MVDPGDLCTLADVKAWLKQGSVAVTGISKAANAVISAPAHNIQTGIQIILTGVLGMTQINGLVLTPTVIDENSFYANLDTSGIGFTAYTSGGFFGADDVLLQNLITAMSEACRNYTSRIFNIETYTETHSGKGYGQREMFLREYPVVSITSVTIDGNTISARVGNGNGYNYSNDLQNAEIVLYGYEFTRDVNNVVIVYSAGYDTLPRDLWQSGVELVAYRYKSSDKIGFRSKTLAGETTSFITSELPDSVKAVWDRYVKRVIYD